MRRSKQTRMQALLCASCMLAAPAFAATADAYPNRPVRLIVPFAPGGGSDNMARLFAPRVTEALGQQVVVDNRPGANTNIGAGIVANAPPDGHTLLLANANHTINPALFKKLPFDSLKDFVPVSPLANVANVLVVNAALPVKSVSDLIALAKSKPGDLNFASPGNGTSSHLAGVLLQALGNIQFVIVPYKGAGPAMTDLIGGQVSMAIVSMSSAIPHVKSGRLRALGVTTAKRSRLMPELPSIGEAGLPGYDAPNWFGILTTKGTPPRTVEKLHATFSRLVQDPEMQKRMAAQGTEPFVATPQEFAKFMRDEVAKWSKLVAQYNIRAE
ncbi:MAG TPA: tripartite tricarboxylate transporter substrate binding protein [Burkholderiales bacterium]|nr:tripartite tricarboxylate transporter substrate binding protein [Burkholderiales bacterium]